MREDERNRVCRQGTQAWQRLKREKSWGDWLKVGEALLVGREWAMNQVGTNQPKGKGYNTAFSEWLTKYKLDDMDKGDCSRLFEVMDNLPQIDEWRQTLTLTDQLKLNHPNSVLRRWKAFMKPEPRPEPGAEPKPTPTLKDSVALLSEENAALKSHIAELEAARDQQQAEPIEVQIARVLDLIVKVHRKLRRQKPERSLSVSPQGNLLVMVERQSGVVTPEAETVDLVALAKELGIGSDDERVKAKTKAKRRTALVWKQGFPGMDGKHFNYSARAGTGAGEYRIGALAEAPSLQFVGYDLTYWPDGAGSDKDNRRLAINVRSLDKAKAIAAADHAKRQAA
jgi:hypothetical protein